MAHRQPEPAAPLPPLRIERWPLRARLPAVPVLLLAVAVGILAHQVHYMIVVLGGAALLFALWSSFIRVLPGGVVEEGWGFLFLALRNRRLAAADVECVALRVEYYKMSMGITAELRPREGEPLPLLPMVTLTRARAAGVRAAKLLGVPFDQRPLGGVLIEAEDVGLPLRDRLQRHPVAELPAPPSSRVSWNASAGDGSAGDASAGDASAGELRVGEGVVTITPERIEVRDEGMFHADGGLPTREIATALVCKVRGFGSVSSQGREALVLVGFGEHGAILSVGGGLSGPELCWARLALERAVALGAGGTAQQKKAAG